MGELSGCDVSFVLVITTTLTTYYHMYFRRSIYNRDFILIDQRRVAQTIRLHFLSFLH
jgi:hypothetical protein